MSDDAERERLREHARYTFHRVRVEMVDTGEWESWCSDHPLPNGDTGVCFDKWADAVIHAFNHAATHHAADPERSNR